MGEIQEFERENMPNSTEVSTTETNKKCFGDERDAEARDGGTEDDDTEVADLRTRMKKFERQNIPYSTEVNTTETNKKCFGAVRDAEARDCDTEVEDLRQRMKNRNIWKTSNVRCEVCVDQYCNASPKNYIGSVLIFELFLYKY